MYLLLCVCVCRYLYIRGDTVPPRLDRIGKEDKLDWVVKTRQAGTVQATSTRASVWKHPRRPNKVVNIGQSERRDGSARMQGRLEDDEKKKKKKKKRGEKRENKKERK
ncbi:hypothetical protein LX32DRAFT_688266 [Colletotrichum zoysiae]|uniref:Secreted protein n=1 Tax=Colletotrichum zoysiae TaxID=1216348 RepID=A0AAD9H199_9PEZI|nr:hypothetical protein LX32DRAFT_688266 [Colletotrichum zoysiae]